MAAAAQPPLAFSPEPVPNYPDLAWWERTRDTLQRVVPGRSVQMNLVDRKFSAGEREGAARESARAQRLTAPRAAKYALNVVDTPTGGARPAQGHNSCGVLLVPQGREHEFLFGQPEGQAQLAQQSGLSRLVFVFLSRGQHERSTVESVKAELAAYMRALAPQALGDRPMPYLAVGDGIGRRALLARVPSEVNGEMIVEEVEGDVRRLVFARSQLVQSEARVLSKRDVERERGRKKKQRRRRRKRQQQQQTEDGKDGEREKQKEKENAEAPKEEEEEEEEEEVKEEGGDDGEEAQAQPRGAAGPGAPVALRAGLRPVDHAHLCSEYHQSVVAMLSLAPQRPRRALLVGLGAGALAMFLQRRRPELELDVVELDPAVVRVAGEFFGFAPGPRCRLFVEDGLAFVQRAAARVREDAAAALRYDAMVVDVNAQDLSVGMTFPPTSFVTRAFLSEVRECLAPAGVAVYNVVARSVPVWEETLAAFEAVFARVGVLEAEAYVNRVVGAFRDASLDLATAARAAPQSEGHVDVRALLKTLTATKGA
jgi:spermidine synthase